MEQNENDCWYSPLLFQDGTLSAPGITYTNETTLGFARLAPGIITATKSLAVTNNLTVSGNTSITGTLGVTGAVTIPNLVEVDGGTF